MTWTVKREDEKGRFWQQVKKFPLRKSKCKVIRHLSKDFHWERNGVKRRLRKGRVEYHPLGLEQSFQESSFPQKRLQEGGMETRALKKRGSWKMHLYRKMHKEQAAGYSSSYKKIWVTRRNSTALVKLSILGATCIYLCKPSTSNPMIPNKYLGLLPAPCSPAPCYVFSEGPVTVHY